MSYSVRRLGPQNLADVRLMDVLFGEAFEDPATHGAFPPGDAYLADVLARPQTIVLVAKAEEAVIGGLVAYRLDKFEQERSEIYLYDLAVAETWRRKGVATALIEDLRRIARECGTWMIFVQGDREDEPALALYRKLGVSEEAPLHFDIEP